MKTRTRLLMTFSILLVAVLLMAGVSIIGNGQVAFADGNDVIIRCNELQGTVSQTGDLALTSLTQAPTYTVNGNALTLTVGDESAVLTATANKGSSFNGWAQVNDYEYKANFLCDCCRHSPTYLSGTITGSNFDFDNQSYYCLSGDVRLKAYITVPEGKTFNLCLCGHDFIFDLDPIPGSSFSNIYRFTLEGNMNLYDCGNGNPQVRYCHDYDADERYETIDSVAGGEKIVGGALTGYTGTSTSMFNFNENLVFNMYGGNVVGNSAYSAPFCSMKEGAEFYMYGGKGIGNKANYNPTFLRGTFTKIVIAGKSEFIRNSGGVLAVTCNNGDFIIQDSVKFLYNKTTSSGGAISYTGNNSPIYINSDRDDPVSFIGNTCANYLFSVYFKADVTVTGKLVLKDNVAQQNYAGIYVNEGNFTLTGSLVVENNRTVTSNHAGIAVNKGNIILNGEQEGDSFLFKNNFSYYYGTCLYVESGDLLINKNTDHPAKVDFIGNSTSYWAGSCIYVLNTSNADGEIYVKGDITLDGNTSHNNGASVQIDQSNAGKTVFEGNITIKNDICDHYSIDVVNGDLKIVGSVSAEGTADKNLMGTAIYVPNGTLTMEGRTGKNDTVALNYNRFQGIYADNVIIQKYKSVEICHNGYAGIYASNGLSVSSIDSVDLSYNGGSGAQVYNSVTFYAVGSLTASNNAGSGLAQTAEYEEGIAHTVSITTTKADAAVSLDNNTKYGLFVRQATVTITGYENVSFNNNEIGFYCDGDGANNHYSSVTMNGGLEANDNSDCGIKFFAVDFNYTDTDHTITCTGNATSGIGLCTVGTQRVVITAKKIDVSENALFGLYSVRNVDIKGTVIANATAGAMTRYGLYSQGAEMTYNNNTDDDYIESKYHTIAGICANDNGNLIITGYKKVDVSNNDSGILVYMNGSTTSTISAKDIVAVNDTAHTYDDSDFIDGIYAQNGSLRLEGNITIDNHLGYGIGVEENGNLEIEKITDTDTLSIHNCGYDAIFVAKGSIHILYSQSATIDIDTAGFGIDVQDSAANDPSKYTCQIKAGTLSVKNIAASMTALYAGGNNKILVVADILIKNDDTTKKIAYGIQFACLTKNIFPDSEIRGSIDISDVTATAIYVYDRNLRLTGGATDTISLAHCGGNGITLTRGYLRIDGVASVVLDDVQFVGINMSNLKYDSHVKADVTMTNIGSYGMRAEVENTDMATYPGKFTYEGMFTASDSYYGMGFKNIDVTITGGLDISNMQKDRITQCEAAAMFVNGGSATVTITKTSKIYDNTYAAGTSGEGGAIVAQDGTFVLNGNDMLTVENNGKDTGYFIYGGAFCFRNEDATVTGVEFYKNKAVEKGGAVYAYAREDCATAKLTLQGCTFGAENKGNYAGDKGGAVYVEGKIPATITSCTFQFNESNYSGGALYVGYTTTIEKCYFYQNTSKSDGGALVVDKGTCTIDGTNGETTFTQNKSTTGKGGAIMGDLSGNKIIVKNNVVFSHNTAALSGGAVYSSGVVELNGGSFSYNEAGKDGGAVCVTGELTDALKITAPAEDSPVSFTHNSASIGGAIFAKSINANGILVQNNDATENTGGMYIREGTVRNATVSENSAKTSGAFYVSDKATFKKCTFSENHVDEYGGVSVINVEMAVNLVDVTITENTAQTGASVFYCRGELNLNGVTITDNEIASPADIEPAALYIIGRLTVGEVVNKTNTITGNTYLSGTDKKEANVYLYYNADMTVADMKNDSEIGLSSFYESYIGKPQQISTEVAASLKDYDQYFTCDHEEYEIHAYKVEEKYYLYETAPWIEYEGILFDSYWLPRMEYVETGNYILKQGKTYATSSYTITDSIEVNLYLNGQELYLDKRTICVYGGKFGIYDGSTEKHYFVQNAEYKNWEPSENNTPTDLWVEGGCIYGIALTSTVTSCNVLYLSKYSNSSSGTVNNSYALLHSGNIIASSHAVDIEPNQTFEMQGGSIQGCCYAGIAVSRGIVHNYYGNFIMTGGVISNNYLRNNYNAVDGSGYYEMGGTAYIWNNFGLEESKYAGLQTNFRFYVSKQNMRYLKISDTKPLESGAKIGISVQMDYFDNEGGVGFYMPLTESGKAGYQYFVTDNAWYAVAPVENNIDTENGECIGYVCRIQEQPATENDCTLVVNEERFSDESFVVSYAWYRENVGTDVVCTEAKLNLSTVEDGSYICVVTFKSDSEEYSYKSRKIHYSDNVIYETIFKTDLMTRNTGLNYNKVLESGRYYLDYDIKYMNCNVIIEEGSVVELCLNGKYLNMSAYHIVNNGTFTLQDCDNAPKRYIAKDGTSIEVKDSKIFGVDDLTEVQEGVIYGDWVNYNDGTEYYNSGAFLANNGTANLFGGIICGSRSYFGAAVLNDADGVLNLNGVTFFGNSSYCDYPETIERATYATYNIVDAGAVMNFGKIYMTTAKFIKNYAAYGAAIANMSGAYFQMDDGIFEENSTFCFNYLDADKEGNGGAVYNAGEMVVNGGLFSGNSAARLGGAICNIGTLTVNGGSFIGNESMSAGGAIYNDNIAVIQNTVIQQNVARGNLDSRGAGIYNKGLLDLYDVTITENETGYFGGGIYACEEGRVLLGKKVVICDNVGLGGKANDFHVGLGYTGNAEIEFSTEVGKEPTQDTRIGVTTDLDLFVGEKIYFCDQTAYLVNMFNDDDTYILKEEEGNLGFFVRTIENPVKANNYTYTVSDENYSGEITYNWYRVSALNEYDASLTSTLAATNNTVGVHSKGAWTTDPKKLKTQYAVLLRSLVKGDMVYFTAQYNVPEGMEYTSYVALVNVTDESIYCFTHKNFQEEFLWMIPQGGNYYIYVAAFGTDGTEYSVTIDNICLLKSTSRVAQTGNRFNPTDMLDGPYACIATGSKGDTVDFKYMSEVIYIHDCDYYHDVIEQEIISSRFDGGKLASGTYYLRDSITLKENLVIAEGETVTICLNGNAIMVGDFCIENHGTLTITDCRDTNLYYVTYNEQKKIWSLSKNNLQTDRTINGGVIAGYTGKGGNGAAVVNYGSFTMYAGSFVGNMVAVKNTGTTNMKGEYVSFGHVELGNVLFFGNGSSGYGSAINNTYGTVEINGAIFEENNALMGTIYTESLFEPNVKTGEKELVVGTGIVTMNSGIIRNNTADYGGAIVCSNGTFIMNDGEIYGNTAKFGGAVNNESALYCFQMNGGTIYDNHASVAGGGIYNNKGVVKISGNATVKDNTAGDDNHPENVYTNVALQVTGALSGEIGVTYGDCLMTMEPFAVTGENADEYSSCFTSDSDYYLIRHEGNVVTLIPIAFSTQPTKDSGFNGYLNDDEVTYQWYKKEFVERRVISSYENFTATNANSMDFKIEGTFKVGDIVTFDTNVEVDTVNTVITYGTSATPYTLKFDSKTKQARFVISIASASMQINLALKKIEETVTVSNVVVSRETLLKGCVDTKINNVTAYGEGIYFSRATHKTATVDSILVPTYRVTFNGNESTSGTDTTVLYNFAGATVTLPTETNYRKADMKFLGWNTDAEQTVPLDLTYEITVGDKEMFAIWTPKKVISVINTEPQTYFSKSGAEFVVKFTKETTLKASEFTVLYRSESANDFTKTVPTKYGVYYVKLVREEDKENDGYASCALEIPDAFILGYKVVVDANGGKGTYTYETVLFDGDEFVVPTGDAFIRDGYTFSQWYMYEDETSGKNLTNIQYESDIISIHNNTTFYAYWIVDIDTQPTSTKPTVEISATDADYQWYVGTVQEVSVTQDLVGELEGDRYVASFAVGGVTMKDGDRIILTMNGVGEIGVNTKNRMITPVRNGYAEINYIKDTYGTSPFTIYATDPFTIENVVVIHYEGTEIKGEILPTIDQAKVTTSKQYFCKITYKACSGINTKTLFVKCTDAVSAYTVSFDKNGAKGIVSTVSNLQGLQVTLPDPVKLTYTNKYFSHWNTQQDGNGASFAANAKFTGTADTILYAIWADKATIGVIEDKQTLVYNGANQTYNVRGSDLDGFVITFRNKNNIKVAAKEVGVYTVVITRPEDETYASFEMKIEDGLTITKKVVNVVYAKNIFTYTGEDQASKVKATFINALGEVTELKTVACYRGETEGVERFKNAGTYTLKYTLSATDKKSYVIKGMEEEEDAVLTQTYDIQKAYYDMNNVTWSTDTLVYNGSAQTVTLGGLPSGVSVASYIGNKATKVGTYTAEVILSYDKDNYNEIDMDRYKLYWQIVKADFDLSGIKWTYDKSKFVFDGTIKKIIMTNLPAGLTVEGYIGNEQIYAGTYAANATFKFDTESYNDVVMEDFEWTIERAETVINTSDVKTEYTYTGKQQIVSKGAYIENHNEGKLIYTNNKFTNVGSGTYYVKIIAPQTENYKKAEATVAIHVSKKSASIDVSGITKTYYYNGKEQSVNSGATLDHIEAKPVYTNNTFTEIGDYIVTVSSPETENYYAASKTVDVTVKKGSYDLSEILFEDESVLFDGEEHTIGIEGVLPEGVSVRYLLGGTVFTSVKEAGNYKISAVFTVDTAHYNEPETKTATLTIRAKTIATKEEGEAVKKDLEITDCENGVDSRLTYTVDSTVVSNLSTTEKEEFVTAEAEKVTLQENELISLVYKVKFSLLEDEKETEVLSSSLGAGQFTIKMAVSDKIDTKKITKILQIAEDGSVTEIKFDEKKLDENGYYEITSGEFVEFVFVERESCTLHWYLLAWLVLILIRLGIVLYVMLKNKDQKDATSIIMIALAAIDSVLMYLLITFLSSCAICLYMFIASCVLTVITLALYLIFKFLVKNKKENA